MPKTIELFSPQDAVIGEDGDWYYRESSIDRELKSVHEQLAKANERVKELE